METTLFIRDEYMNEEEAACTTIDDWILVITIIISVLIAIPISIWTMYQHRQDHIYKLANNTPSSKFLYTSCIIFYITCVIYMMSAFIAVIVFRCFGDYDSYLMVAEIIVLSYIIHWALLITIYLSRLYYVFKGSALAMPSRHIWYFIAFSISLILCIVGVQILHIMYPSSAMVIFGWVVSFSFTGSLNLVLCAMFIRKLYHV